MFKYDTYDRYDRGLCLNFSGPEAGMGLDCSFRRETDTTLILDLIRYSAFISPTNST